MKIVRKTGYIIVFLIIYLIRLIRSNISVAWDVLTPRFHMKPGIIKVPVNLTSNHQILALVNLITMTPGTISLDLSDDKKVLYIHAMYIKDSDAFYKDIMKLEKMIKRAF